MFAAYVRGCWTGLPVIERGPEALERALRRWHSLATVVVQSPLAGFGGATWYVYRDGRPGMAAEEGWWAEPGVATVTFDDSGCFTSANGAAEALAGRPIVGLHWQDLVPPEARSSDGAWVWEALRRDGLIQSAFDLPVDDERRVIEYRTTAGPHAGEYQSHWRQLTTIDLQAHHQSPGSSRTLGTDG